MPLTTHYLDTRKLAANEKEDSGFSYTVSVPTVLLGPLDRLMNPVQADAHCHSGTAIFWKFVCTESLREGDRLEMRDGSRSVNSKGLRE